jgi:hypothetical protein
MDLREKTTNLIGDLLRAFSTITYRSSGEFKSERLLFALTPEFTYPHT